MAQRSPELFQVGIVCALPKEMTATRAILDEEYEALEYRDERDSNTYVLGNVGKHLVVVACLPAGAYGTNAAATVAKDMLRTFPKIRFGLMVGIGGGIPSANGGDTVRLGDVVVSQPSQTHGGVIQYDLGKEKEKGRFLRTGFLNRPPTVLLTALSMIQSHPAALRRRLYEGVSAMSEQDDLAEEGFAFPGADQDHLYCDWCDRSQWLMLWWIFWLIISWINPIWRCNTCENGRIPRSRTRDGPQVHYGIIASGNLLIKNVRRRNQLTDEFGALCVEMEAAGLMNEFPCIVIRGVCDYADSHKNDAWQNYATLTAAAFARELLLLISPAAVHSTMLALDELNNRTHELLDQGNQLQRQAIQEFREISQKRDMRHKTEEEQACHSAFKTGAYEVFKNNNPIKAPGTCQWVFDHHLFQAWRRSNKNDLLWISADPGCGKSVLARSLVDHELTFQSQNSICYFFFKDIDVQNNLPDALCALVHQLFSQQPSLLQHALPLWRKHKDKIKEETEELWRMFIAAATDPSTPPVLCILDALDECRDEHRRQLIAKVCEFYKESTTGTPNTLLRILMTSRPYDNVQRWFVTADLSLQEIQLRGQDENARINEEINSVIDQYIVGWTSEFALSKGRQERLRAILKDMEHRTYLWLHLAVEEIRSTYRDSPNPDEASIERLPQSVGSAYENILQRISAKQRYYARKVLLIIIGARRPLTVEEMGKALSAAKAYDHDQEKMETPNVQHLEANIREWCGLMVYFQDAKLFLMHQTVKEYLLSDGSTAYLETGKWKSSLTTQIVEMEMACLCITYLCLANDTDYHHDSQGNLLPTTSPWIVAFANNDEDFFEYCAKNWTSHLADEDSNLELKKLLDRTLLLYDTTSKQCQAWFRLWWESSHLNRSLPSFSRQHVVAMHGHLFILKYLTQTDNTDLNARDSRGTTVLWRACAEGQERVVRWLLEQQVEVNAHGRCSKSPLYVASSRGYEKIVQLLLDANADINADGGDSGTALTIASYWGHETVVRMLIDSGADVNIRVGSGDTALMAASRNGHETIIRLLLDGGAYLNTGGTGITAFDIALQRDHPGVVRTLLDWQYPDPSERQRVERLRSALLQADENQTNMSMGTSSLNFEDAWKQLAGLGLPRFIGLKKTWTAYYDCPNIGYTRIDLKEEVRVSGAKRIKISITPPKQENKPLVVKRVLYR